MPKETICLFENFPPELILYVFLFSNQIECKLKDLKHKDKILLIFCVMQLNAQFSRSGAVLSASKVQRMRKVAARRKDLEKVVGGKKRP